MHRMTVIAVCVVIAAVASRARAEQIHHVESDRESGSSAAVLVGDVPLLHTAQLFPADETGETQKDAASQFSQLLTNLGRVLSNGGSDFSQLVKLNIYASSGEVAQAAERGLAARIDSENRPAVSYVITALPHGALVALDAIAVSARPITAVTRSDRAAILPAGSRLYVSGQAERGDLQQATRKTLESLTATLRHFELDLAHVVHIKCFVQPIDEIAAVEAEIVRHFGGELAPPISFVQWRSSLPIEIELVAWGGKARGDEGPIEFLTPPGMSASPLYSRVTRIHHGGSIFMSGLYGNPESDAAGQLTEAFEKLRRLLEKTGSDFKHLAKATYYVSDDETSQQHNEIRPKYFDAQRPPAASKALVAGTGKTAARFTMDMIAVPSSRGTPDSGPEHGHGLTAEEAAQGWISLFDGSTTFGWTDARVTDGTLEGGTSTTRLGNCRLRATFTRSGPIEIGGRTWQGDSARPLVIDATGTRAAIRLADGTVLRTLCVQPLDLQPLFNGTDLTGWKRIERRDRPSRSAASSAWSVDGSAMRAIGGPGAIEHETAQFADGVIQLDIRTRAVHSNGGVFFRSVPGDFMNGYEAQIHNRCLDNDPARPFRYSSGGIDDRQDARRLVSRDFAPFRMTIVADGTHLATWINGVQVTDWTDDRAPDSNPRRGRRTEAGTIQLQAHDPATDYEVRQLLIGHWK